MIFQITPVYLEAASSCTEWVAKVVSVQGKVETQRLGIVNWKAIQQGDVFCQGDKIRSEKNSRATLQLSNSSLISVDQNTNLNFSVPKVEAASSWLIELFKGSAFFRSRESQRLNINTPFINAVHEGTEFLVTVNSEQTEITVFDGQVAGTNQQGKIHIKKGYTGIAKKGEAPRVKALTIRPEDAVQWALYYPPIVDYQHLKSAAFKPAINAYEQGNAYQSLGILEDIPTDQRDEGYLVLKSSLLLTVGRVEEALELIKQARSLNQNESSAIALQSIISVAKNRQDEALKLAQQAVTLNPQSAIAQIALSYAYQANFKIEPALQATKEATRLSPDNALAWARLSELQLSTGQRSHALESAKKAQALNPQLSRTHTILGFANLAEVDIDEAKTAFNQAIHLNSADPLARLGLGLAKIREGDVEEGTLDLETAVSLDPDNAIMRSYLGKAYYELKNDGYAGTELAIAKEMDAKDPTPWFYDAIRKQTTNWPVEALHDMQKAIELNDNRGVYRSKLLLDEDLAARSASLGRIYNDLDFQQLGLVQGWKSVIIDPGNYSSHRLLADNYAALPRHEVARVSELLQSQLLQPINISPVQPLLSENNLQVLDGLGPSEAAFNEFNPLFTRNRFALQSSGVFGINDTWGEEVIQSGLLNSFSYSLGQHHYETDGFRSNNFLKRDLYNVFIQDQLTSDLNLQAEYKYEDRSNGDLSFNFDPIDFSGALKENRKVATYRIGGRYDLSLNSIILGSLIYQDVKINKNTPISQDMIDRNGYIAEMQNIYKHQYFSAITGFSHINQDVKGASSAFGLSEKTFPDITSTNFYSYWLLYPTKQLSVTLGVALNFFKIQDIVNHSHINPKIGLIWKPFESTTVRAAVFKHTSVSRTASQTIEPTQLAGFNQFFDDFNGSVPWRYGVAIDHVFSPELFVGLEYSERRIDTLMRKSFSDWKEKLARTYLFWTPHSRIAFGMEYAYERFDRENSTTSGIVDVKTHKIPLSFSFFNETGFSVKIKGTYINQKGTFKLVRPPQSEYRGSDNFFLFDANISYRLPNRYGIFSIGINNIFDKKFKYQNTSVESPSFTPERFLFSRFTLAF